MICDVVFDVFPLESSSIERRFMKNPLEVVDEVVDTTRVRPIVAVILGFR